MGRIRLQRKDIPYKALNFNNIALPRYANTTPALLGFVCVYNALHHTNKAKQEAEIHTDALLI